MTTTPVGTTPPAATNPTNTGTSAQDELAGNFDTFLQLLTTQLQNQDPLSPMDSNQFTQQLVEFSQVEQQIDSNSNLQTLISLSQGQSAGYAVSYLGKSVTTNDGSGSLQNGAADWSYTLNGSAASTLLTVSDAKGNVVYVANGDTDQGTHDFAWNGQDNAGNALPDGTYTLGVTAADPSGAAIGSSVSSSGIVSEVDLSGTEPTLMVGGMAVPISKATLISN